jgi:hypothetical protein
MQSVMDWLGRLRGDSLALDGMRGFRHACALQYETDLKRKEEWA